jgi:hypothetical protein
VEQVETGKVIELRDSMFRFSPSDPDVGSEGVYLHNYWTIERIEPGATYRFTAQREGEVAAEAEVKIPLNYDVEVWLSQPGGDGDRVRLSGLKHVAMVVGLWHVYGGPCGDGVQRIPFGAGSANSDVQTISISRALNSREGCGRPEVEKRELMIVGSGAPWPLQGDYSTTGLGVPDGPSNISNSVGFLGGVLTRRVPYENCEILGANPSREPCRLHYDENSVTLRGTVRNAACADAGRLSGAPVELREINPDPAANRKLRFTTSDRTGEYEIGALEAGVRYYLRVRRKAEDQYDGYREHTDTLQFAAGEQATYDVDLLRYGC